MWNSAAVADPGYLIDPAALAVSERSGAAVVGELVVENPTDRPALLLAGELLEGGQQHRLAARSTLVEPGASQVLPVRCIEQGRWHGDRSHRRSGRRVPLTVASAGGQGETWGRIRRMEDAFSAGGDTHYLGDALVDADWRAAELVRGLEPLPFTSGVLIAVGGQPLHLEVFDSPGTLAAAWPHLLQAAAVDALSAPPVPTPGRRARRFLDGVRRLSAAGGGWRMEGLTLETLVWNGRTVHATATNRRHELVGVR